MKNNIKITPAYLRIGLFVSMAVLFIAAGVGFYFFRSSLETLAGQVNNDSLVASSSDLDVAKLQVLKKQLADGQVGVTRAKSIVAESQKYQYQNQIIDDLTSYANRAGFSIENFTFADPSSAAAPGAAAPSGSTLAVPLAPLTAPTGLKTTIATITLSKSLTYVELMNFFKSIEDNLTKMEITGISIALDPTTGTIKPNPIQIEVYVHEP